MFRGRNQVDGKWVTQEFSVEEMLDFLTKVSNFNKAAWMRSVQDARDMLAADKPTPENEFELAKVLFDKLGLNTFSVIHNQAQNMRD
jgi:hypothetical protein